MSDQNWEKVKDALRKPATPEAMQEAAQAFAEYRKVSLGRANSNPTLVRLEKGTGIPYAVPLDQIPDELAKNPEFFQFMKKIVAREKS